MKTVTDYLIFLIAIAALVNLVFGALFFVIFGAKVCPLLMKWLGA